MAHDADGILKYMKQLVPEAKTVRSHSLIDGSLIASCYDKHEIKFDLNKYIVPMQGLRIYPYKSHVSNALVLPFIFEDDLWLMSKKENSVEFYLSEEFEAPLIFNFHPVHLFLNTPSLAEYDKTRKYYKDASALAVLKNEKVYGVRDFFCELVKRGKENGYEFKKISEGAWV